MLRPESVSLESFATSDDNPSTLRGLADHILIRAECSKASHSAHCQICTGSSQTKPKHWEVDTVPPLTKKPFAIDFDGLPPISTWEPLSNLCKSNFLLDEALKPTWEEKSGIFHWTMPQNAAMPQVPQSTARKQPGAFPCMLPPTREHQQCFNLE